MDAVIRNPVLPLFLQSAPEAKIEREAITYVGRLHRAKNVGKLLPAMRDVLDENPGLCAWIIGDGPLRSELESLVASEERIQFLGALAPTEVRDRLRRSRVFVSANPTEPFGIVYLEALSQGCQVIMPASGGGLEIAPELIGTRIQMFHSTVTRGEVASALRRALDVMPSPKPISLDAYSPRAVAGAYLAVDARFNAQGMLDAGGIR